MNDGSVGISSQIYGGPYEKNSGNRNLGKLGWVVRICAGGRTLFFGNETGNFLQIITDDQARMYRNVETSFFYALSQTQGGYIMEYAIPKTVIIRSDLSQQVIKANFYRAVAEPGGDVRAIEFIME